MRIAYVTNVRLPSERAHGHQIAQVADAMAHLGHDVTVFAPFRKNVVKDDYWTYYGADREVKLSYVGSFDFIASWLFPGPVGLFAMNAMIRKKIVPKLLGNFDLLYTRAPALLSALLQTNIPVMLELHQLPNRDKKKFVEQCNRCRLVVCLASPIREELLAWGVEDKKMIVAGDGVDVRRFAQMQPVNDARTYFGFQTDRLVVGYVGRLKTLGMDKGVADILKALALLQESKSFFGLIVGGPDGDKKEYVALARSLGLDDNEVKFVGEVPALDVPVSMAACDILAMPFPDKPHFRTHMSPLKMFEYMAASRPIVTSDLPTIRDVLSDDVAVFCKPSDPQSLADGLTWIKNHPTEATKLAMAARGLVEEYTWEQRMQRVLASATLGA